MKKGNYMATC